MRTSKEKFKDELNRVKRKIIRIYNTQVKPFYDTMEQKDYASPEYLNYFEKSIDVEDFEDGLDSVVSHLIYDFMDEYAEDYEDLAYYEQMAERVGKTCVGLYKHMEDARKKKSIEGRNKGIVQRKTLMDNRIEDAHSHPRNLRPTKLDGRLYGEETRAPQRKRAAPKKRTPAVRVNVRKMF